MTTLTVNSKRKVRQNVQTTDECPICKAAGYRLRPEVEEAIARSEIKSFDNVEDFFKDLGI